MIDAVAVVLQTGAPTPPPEPLAEPFLQGDWFTGLAKPFTSLLGTAVAAVLVAMVLGGVLLEWSESLVVPTVLGILVGGFIIQFLPPAAQVAAILLILFGGAYALFTAWNGSGASPR